MGFPDRGMPASGPLERAYYPTPERIAAKVGEMLGKKVGPRPELLTN